MSVLKLIHRSLSDSDLRKLLGTDLKIVKYSDLANVQDLDALLPQPQDYCIVLYEEMPNAGHWTGLLKYDDRYEHFDSYGVAPDKELHWINPRMREKLNETMPYLSKLLKQVPYLYSTVKYQSEEHSVNTCGDHVAHRLFCLKNQNMTLAAYHDYMKQLKRDTQSSYDYIVAEFVRRELLDRS